MSNEIVQFAFIDQLPQLEKFYQQNKAVEWMCFDTEFVGEKRFVTQLCLIQVTTTNGNYLIDPLVLPNIDLFLKMVEDPAIIKITHAGDNDYRLLNNLYGTIPKNVFDTQIAAGFVGYKYPISFRRLVESELRISLKKGYAVADWESRPVQKKQLHYALDDVMPLYDIWQSLKSQLERRKRLHWAEEELSQWESAAIYDRDPHLEAINSNLIKSVSLKEKVFLIRLFEWRRNQAEKKNYSKEMILSGKLFGHIIKAIRSGKDALRKNRRIPDRIIERYGQLFMDMYERPVSAEERAIIAKIPDIPAPENADEDIMTDILYLLVKHKSISSDVAPSLVLPKNLLNKMKMDTDLRHELIDKGWRREMLGDNFAEWFLHVDELELEIDGGKIEIKVKHQA